MKIIFHSKFKKQYKKLKPDYQKRFDEKLKLFSENPFDLVLNNHPLKREYAGQRSININGDIRAIYKKESENYIFIAIGSHSELY